MTAPTAWLVWRPGMRGPTPEIWFAPALTQDSKLLPILARHPLDAADARLSTAELAKKYPAPATAEASS